MRDLSSSEIDLDAMMRAIRAEVARRKVAGGAAVAGSFGPTAGQPETPAAAAGPAGATATNAATPLVLARRPDAGASLEAKERYRLADFLQFHDESFVRNAYLRILRRSPDGPGFAGFLAALREGRFSKTEIAGRMRYSREGRAVGVKVAGLPLAFALRTIRRVPVIGRVLGIVQYVLRLPDIVRNHERLEAAVFHRELLLNRHLNVVAGQIENAVGSLDGRMRTAESNHVFVQQAVTHLTSRIGASEMDLRDLVDSTGRLRAEHERHVGNVARGLGRLESEVVRIDADKAARADTERVLAALNAGKSDRSEVQAVQAAVARVDVAKADRGATARALAALADGKSDRTEMERVKAELARVDGAKAERGDVGQVRAEMARVDATKADRGETAGALAALAEAKSDRAEVEQVKVDVTRLDAAKADREDTSQALAALAETKSDRAEVEQVKLDVTRVDAAKADREDTSRALAAMAEVKSDRGEVEQVRAEVTRVDAAKADRSEIGKLVAAVESRARDLREAVATARDEVDARMTALRREVADDIVAAGEQPRARADEHERELVRVAVVLAGLESGLRRNEQDLAPLVLESASRAARGETLTDEQRQALDGFYLAFENRFRGTEQDIRSRLTVYLPAVGAAGIATAEAPLVDLGSGRGEWLSLLKEHGFTARGVDNNSAMAQVCREQGLEVVESDAVHYLKMLPAGTLGAVTAFHLIEHVPFNALLAMFEESLRVLRPGGLLIFETPNPENLVTGACNFYLDPTHRNPLPPAMLSFIAEARGFERVEILRLHPSAAPTGKNGEPLVPESLQSLLYGPQDYSILARKPGVPAAAPAA